MTDRSVTSFETVEHPAAVVVTVRGDVDVSTAREFRSALTAAAGTGRRRIVVDLGDVAFLDSAGLAVVFGLRRVLPAEQEVALANVRPRMLRLLRTAAVTSVVEVHAEDQPWPWPDVPRPGAPRDDGPPADPGAGTDQSGRSTS